MLRRIAYIFLTTLVLCFLLKFPNLQAQTPGEIARITKAVPVAATAIPQKARRLLVITYCGGYKHSAIPYATKALQLMGELTGAFTVEVVDSLTILNFREKLEKYDAICLNNTTGWKLENAAARRNLLDFVRQGKGLIGIHAATDNFYNWPEGQEMIGGVFNEHPWHSGGTWKVKIDDPTHPLARMFPGSGFSVNDEIYRIKSPFMRAKRRVLLSLDFTDSLTAHAKGVQPGDFDVAISWIASFGKGRVFYCSLGHNHWIYWNPAILQHYLDGIQFALGDLPLDTTPSFDVALQRAAGYQYGQSRFYLTRLADYLRAGKANPEVMQIFEDKLVRFLKGEATTPAKQFVLRQLSMYGSSRSVETIGKLLFEPRLCEAARYALERIGGEQAMQWLRKAAHKLPMPSRIGVLVSLGNLHDEGSLSVLAENLKAEDSELRRAAAFALGEIGTKAAADLLQKARREGDSADQVAVVTALMRCADRLLHKGQENEAIAFYQSVYEDRKLSERLRAAGLHGLLSVSEEGTADLVVEALQSASVPLQRVALAAVSGLESEQELNRIAEFLPRFSGRLKAQLIAALGRGSNASVLPAIRPCLKDSSLEVRLAAIAASGQIGGVREIDLLLPLAFAGSSDEREAAREALAQLRGREVDAQLIQRLESTSGEGQAEIIEVLRQRGCTEAVAAVQKRLDHPVKRVRLACYAFLGELADSTQLEALALRAGNNISDSEFNALKAGILRLARRSSASFRDRVLEHVLKKLNRPEHQARLLGVLGELSDEATFQLVQSFLDSENPLQSLAAISAFSAWKSAKPFPLLLRVAQEDPKSKKGILATRAAIQVVRGDKQLDHSEKLNRYKKVEPLCRRVEEKRLWLSAMSRVEHPMAIDLLLPMVNAADLQKEVQAALLSVAGRLKSKFPDKCRSAVQKVLDASTDPQIRADAEKLLKELK